MTSVCGVIVFGDFIICLTSSYSLHDARRGSVFRGAVIMVHWQWIVTEWHKRGKPIDKATRRMTLGALEEVVVLYDNCELLG